MLEELHVRGLALIEDAWLEFGPGFNVLTGETGAGKTVLVEALKLLLGERADATMVRAGCDEAVVEGRFVVDGIERLVRRRVSAEGRSRCYLDGGLATVGELAASLGPLVDLLGQHDHQALLAPANHAAYLDRFAGDEALAALAAYRASLTEYASAVAARDTLAEALRDRDRREDQLRFQAGEIAGVAPKEGEDEEISARLPRLRHGERLAEASARAHAALRGEEAACDRVSEAVHALAAVEGLDPALDALAARLGAVAAETDDLGRVLREYGEEVDYDPSALNEAEARLAALSTLKRKYGPTLADVVAAREDAERQLGALETGEAGLAEAETRVAAAADELRRAGGEVSALRAAAVPGFERELAEAAGDLAMPKARFAVTLEPLPFASWSAAGPERVEFLFSSSAGDPPRPLARIASGGEVSRVMLALKGVLGGADDVPVLVFDEVDAGIGGATAIAVGRRLAQLAGGHQVVAITHLAQVAAFGDRHLVVEKEERDGRALTVVRAVDADERVAEVARMLSGSDTATSIAHARELMESARAAS